MARGGDLRRRRRPASPSTGPCALTVRGDGIQDRPRAALIDTLDAGKVDASVGARIVDGGQLVLGGRDPVAARSGWRGSGDAARADDGSRCPWLQRSATPGPAGEACRRASATAASAGRAPAGSSVERLAAEGRGRSATCGPAGMPSGYRSVSMPCASGGRRRCRAAATCSRACPAGGRCSIDASSISTRAGDRTRARRVGRGAAPLVVGADEYDDTGVQRLVLLTRRVSVPMRARRAASGGRGGVETLTSPAAAPQRLRRGRPAGTGVVRPSRGPGAMVAAWWRILDRVRGRSRREQRPKLVAGLGRPGVVGEGSEVSHTVRTRRQSAFCVPTAIVAEVVPTADEIIGSWSRRRRTRCRSWYW